MKHILMYSGGVDSTLCLKHLVDRGITPFLVHFRTKKMNKSHETRIKRVAKALSPESPLYVYESVTGGYRASFSTKYPYYFIRWRLHGPRKEFCPLILGDVMVLGYMRWIYYMEDNQCGHVGRAQQLFIDFCELYGLPFMFPLAGMKRSQVDELFRELPKSIRMNVVSDTRHYDFGGGTHV